MRSTASTSAELAVTQQLISCSAPEISLEGDVSINSAIEVTSDNSVLIRGYDGAIHPFPATTLPRFLDRGGRFELSSTVAYRGSSVTVLRT